MSATARIPVPMTVVGGFLGAGKTTLVNHLLGVNHGLRFAVMVNDFGELAVDDRLIARHDGDTITFANGCVCCTLGDNFLRSIKQLLDGGGPPPEQILVEASGVADPRAIAEVATLHPRLRRDLVLVLADAESLRARADDELTADTVRRQLDAADLIVLNKTDLVGAERRRSLRRWLAGQGAAAVAETERARLPLALLASASRRPAREMMPAAHDTFKTVTLAADARYDIDRLRRELAELPRSVLRVKGFVRAAAPGDEYYLLQRSGRQLELRRWADSAAPGLTFIGTRELPAAESLARRLAAAIGE